MLAKTRVYFGFSFLIVNLFLAFSLSVSSYLELVRYNGCQSLHIPCGFTSRKYIIELASLILVHWVLFEMIRGY